MNPRSLIDFFKKPVGAFILFCVVLAVGFFALKRFLPGATRPHPLVYSTKAAAAEAHAETMQTFPNTNYVPMANPPPPEPTPAIPLLEHTFSSRTKHAPPKPQVLPISLFAEKPTPKPKPLSKDYAPYGRLIPCELIVTVDSASIQTPIIGLVTKSVYYDGRLIIPAGTEVHGKAQTDRSRERIASGDSWTLVWQDGRELRISGIALDRQTNPDGSGWGITDGSAGLRGTILKSDNMAEIKLFAATFLSGAAGAFTQTQPTIYGNQIVPTLQNAPLTGAQAVLQAYAKQIYDSIQRDGFYVRVPAGKQFYLYVTQTIDVSDATIGGTRFDPNMFASKTNQTLTVPLPRYFSSSAAPTQNGVMP
jgi:Bacterial conjugation TrbI-like protein